MLNDIFETLGFKEDETKAYLALLENGPQTAGNLAKIMGMARPTLYGYLEKLINGGLVTQSIKNGVKIFVPESGERLRVLYRRKINDLENKEKALNTIIPTLEKRTETSLMRPRIQFFEGRSGMETALQDLFNYPGIPTKTFWSIKSSIEAASEDFFWYHNKERIKRNISIDAIWPKKQAIDIRRYPALGVGSEYKREIRITSDDIFSSMGYWIYANKVLFVSSKMESFCFIIESAELVEMMSNQHKVIWDMSAPLKVDPQDMKPFLDDLHNDEKI